MAEEDKSESLEESSRKRSIWRRRSFVEEISTQDGASGNRSNMQTIKDTARRRADQAMRVYTGALGELREELQPSHFESWTLEQMQEFLISLNVELRGVTMLSRASFVAILEKMFKGAAPDELPQPPEPLTEDFKKRQEKAARLLQDRWFLKKSNQWSQATVSQPESDGHLEANPLPSPGGVMRAAARGRMSEDTPWVPPSIEVARRFHDAMHPRLPEGGKFNVLKAKTGRFCSLGGCGEQLDLWDEGMISHFALYGAGVTSYFKFLKYCCWSFFVVSCAVLAHLFVNFNGGSITTVSNFNRISWTTIGNLGNSVNVTEVVLPFCDAEQYSTCIVDKETLGMYYGYIDAGMVILLLAGYFWVNGFITDEFITIKRNTVTAADFTVMVKNIPPDVTEEEISDHFSTVLNRKVVEVAIARDNRRCISLYQRSGHLYHERAATRDLIRYLETKAASREDRFKIMEEASSTGVGDAACEPSSATLDAAVEEVGWFERWRKERQMRQLQAKRERASRKIISLAAEAKLVARTTNIAVAAYVTFEEEMGAVDARVRYSGSWTRWMSMKRKMRLKGRRIQVSEAEEPSTILWENFGYTSCELWARRFFTFAVGYTFLTLSIGMSIWALYRNQEADDAGGTTPCPADWNTMSSEEQADAVEEDKSILHCLCRGGSTSLLWLDPSDICFEYIQAVVEANGLVVATSLMVAATNAGINMVAKAMGAFEKHTSMDKQEVSTFRRLVLLKCVNIGLTVIITNSRRVIDLIGVNLNYEEDFTPDWYRTLGSSVVVNVMINAITPHLYWLGMWIRRRRRWKQAKDNPSDVISQDALHEITKGGRWEISHRYAEITVIFAVCLAYSAGMPLLLPVGAVSFVVFYWVEKALFVHFYTTPPKYSGKLTHEVINLIPYCLWVHTVFALYMYGNGSVFPVPEEDDGQSAEEAVVQASGILNFTGKLKVKAVQPLMVPLTILSVMILERWVGKTVVTGFSSLVVLLTCKGKIASRKLESFCNAVTVDYSRAAVRGILRGLPSYNILLNPKYKDSFGLSDAFAAKHKRVGSIHMLVGEHPSILEVRKIMRSEAKARRAGKRRTPRRKHFVADDAHHNTPETAPRQQDPPNSSLPATPSSTRSIAESPANRPENGAVEPSVSHESSSPNQTETPHTGVP